MDTLEHRYGSTPETLLCFAVFIRAPRVRAEDNAGPDNPERSSTAEAPTDGRSILGHGSNSGFNKEKYPPSKLPIKRAHVKKKTYVLVFKSHKLSQRYWTGFRNPSSTILQENKQIMIRVRSWSAPHPSLSCGRLPETWLVSRRWACLLVSYLKPW